MYTYVCCTNNVGSVSDIYLPVVQEDPVHAAVQEHVLGAVHLPPLEQDGLQTAT